MHLRGKQAYFGVSRGFVPRWQPVQGMAQSIQAERSSSITSRRHLRSLFSKCKYQRAWLAHIHIDEEAERALLRERERAFEAGNS